MNGVCICPKTPSGGVAFLDIPAIKNTRLFLDLVSSLGVNRERIVFAMNRYDKRIGITPEKIGENLKVDVAAIIPLDERAVIPSVNRGVPFILGNKPQPASEGILSLAENVGFIPRVITNIMTD